MKIPMGDLDWFDVLLAITLVIVVAQTSGCVIEVTKLNCGAAKIEGKK